MSSLISKEIKSKVSSVLNKDTQQFGKKHLFDGEEESCWNSDQGLPQWIELEFPGEGVVVKAIFFKFQGGFAGKKCTLLGRDFHTDWKSIFHFYPKDVSSEQIFETTNNLRVNRIRIVFEESYDLYGRITVYKLDILGVNKL